MADTHYERLSFFDMTYLALERGNSYMHIAAIQVFEAAPLRRADGGIDIDKIRRFVQSRLHHIPRYRQRLAWIPVDGFPIWVDDEHFSLDYHVRHTALPKPGGEAELKRLAARVFAQQLDRSRPLWEMWVVEGLDDDRFAIVVKVHHSMIDGMAGVDLLKVMLNLYPTEEMEEPRAWAPRPAPSDAELLIDEGLRLAKLPFDSLRTAGELLTGGRAAREDLFTKVGAAWRTARSGWFTRSVATPVNQELSPHRRFEWLTTSLDEVKEIKNALGGTVNDTVLAVVAGGVRRFLTGRGVDFDQSEYRVMVPVSTRQGDQAGELGNQVAMWLVDLPIAEPDPERRLAAVRAATDQLKEDDAALGATVLTSSASWMPLNLLSLGVRLMWNAARPFNMTVTNVPGPQIPIYLLGSKMLVQYPMVPLYMDHGIGVALFSYSGEVAWGIGGDYDLVPDIADFAAAIGASHEEMLAAARAKAASPAKKRAVRKPRAKAAAAAKTAAKKPATKAVTAKKPATKTAAATKAVTAKKPATKTAAAKKPVAAKKPATKKPATKPAAKKPAAKKPAAPKKPAPRKSAKAGT